MPKKDARLVSVKSGSARVASLPMAGAASAVTKAKSVKNTFMNQILLLLVKYIKKDL